MRLAIDQSLGALTTYNYVFPAGAGYDSTLLGLGPLMVQNNGGTNETNWAGPVPINVARPMEFTTPIPAIYPWAMQWSTNLDWIFLADNAAAALTRRVMYATFNRTTGLFNIVGFITVTCPPNSGNNTIAALRMSYDTHTDGTVGVSGTAVTGSSTNFVTDGACVGNRIGFGSTDPTVITTWYEISAIGSGTSITLTTSAGTISGGTSYVIEDLRCVMAYTCATATNGGLFVVKGLRPEFFTSTGTGGAVPAAVSTDNIRACYWLKDAATETNTAPFGMGLQDETSKSSQMVWVGDTVANPVLFNYNIRASLTLTLGAATNAFVLKTGSGGVPTGTVSKANNGRVGNLGHGPGIGVDCFYFTSTTRVYRTVALSAITSLSTTWLSGGDVMNENPPGTLNTFALTGAMNSLEYASSIDLLLVATAATTTPFRSYATKYNTTNAQMDRVFGCDTRQTDDSLVDGTTTPVPSTTGGPYSLWAQGGLCYLATIGTTSITNRIYAIPLSVDWEYSDITFSSVILPAFSTVNANKFVRAYVMTDEVVGGATGHNLGTGPEPFRVQYRTTGISDNSGAWTILDSSLSLAGVAGTAQIQLRIDFRTIGLTCVPARILAAGVIYDDISTDTHYQYSIGQSSLSSKQFSWRFSTAFGSAVPRLRVRLFDAISGGSLIDDDSTTRAGTWEQSTNGGSSYSTWTTTDKGNNTTYLRYTPASLADSINVRPVLTLY